MLLILRRYLLPVCFGSVFVQVWEWFCFVNGSKMFNFFGLTALSFIIFVQNDWGADMEFQLQLMRTKIIIWDEITMEYKGGVETITGSLNSRKGKHWWVVWQYWLQEIFTKLYPWYLDEPELTKSKPVGKDQCGGYNRNTETNKKICQYIRGVI